VLGAELRQSGAHGIGDKATVFLDRHAAPHNQELTCLADGAVSIQRWPVTRRLPPDSRHPADIAWTGLEYRADSEHHAPAVEGGGAMAESHHAANANG
jgi:hypothetical protein